MNDPCTITLQEHKARVDQLAAEARNKALEEAIAAIRAEYLEDPQDCEDDIAYDNAVRDCEMAVVRLRFKHPSLYGPVDRDQSSAKEET